VRPSFAPHGPTKPVTLLFDDTGVTQLAGAPAVAWQTPWSEVAHLRLVRRREEVTIVAVVATVLYQWRRSEPLSRAQLDELRTVLSSHGGREMPRSRRNSALAVALVVTLSSFGGYIGGLFSAAPTSPVVTALEGVNLNARDVSGAWASSSLTSSSLLTDLATTPGQVVSTDPATTTTLAAQGSPLALAGFHFQRCLGVASVDDRIFGLAGTAARYQVSSPVFFSPDLGGIQVESTAQYYDSPHSVDLDVAEMSRASFGRCFAQSLGDALVGANTSSTPNLTTGANLSTPTFAKGWVRGGDVPLSLPTLQVSRAHFVVIVESAGHYEVTLYALVVNLSRTRATIVHLANALLARMTSTSVVSA
jgi:hypothetical protein